MNAAIRWIAILVALSGSISSGGLAQAPLPRDLGFWSDSIGGSEVNRVPAGTLLGGLAGRVAGARVLQPSGEPGSAPSLQLRGASTLRGSRNPLLIVDGIHTHGSFADISPEDVESIEIDKGPAGASRYGFAGANGVIRVSTKRGRGLRAGTVQVRVRNEIGGSSFGRRLEETGAHRYQVVTLDNGQIDFARAGGGARIAEADGVADNPYPRSFDREGAMRRTGLFLTNHLSAEGRYGRTTFYASAENARVEGVVFALEGFRRHNFRLNADHAIGRRLTIGVHGFYGESTNGQTSQGPGSPLFHVRFVEPHVNFFEPNPDGSRYQARIPDRFANAANPLYTLANAVNTTGRERLQGGVKAEWRPAGGVVFSGSHSISRTDNNHVDGHRPGLLRPDGSALPASSTSESDQERRSNTGVTIALSHRWHELGASISLGYERQTHERDRRKSEGSPACVPEFGCGSLLQATTHSERAISTTFAAAALDLPLDTRIQGTLRRDALEESLISRRTTTYYSLGAAWRPSRTTRVHAAYGTAGLPLDVAIGPRYDPLDGLRREVRLPTSREFELGGDLSTGDARLWVGYGYSRKETKDQVDFSQYATPSGFFTALANVGTVASNTHELTVGYEVLRRPTSAWTVRLTGDRTRQRITAFTIPSDLGPPDAYQPAIFFHGRQSALGVMYGNRAMRSIGELYDDPAKEALSGPGQPYDPENFLVNEEGYVVSKALWRTPNERPIDYVACRTLRADGSCALASNIVPIGDATPDFSVGLSSELRVGGVRLTGLLDWSQGGDIYNGSRQWPMLEDRDLVTDQRRKPAAERKPAAYYGYFYNNLNGQAFFVESATWVKLREMSVDYTLSRRQLRAVGLGRLGGVTIGVAGRNLFTFSGYNGYDPETSSVTDDPFQYRTDWFSYPHFRTLTGVVQITF
ncbi:MAG: TonB-dependent receptor plug domain-containing protein [Gemmatimonadales bacterium]|nr:TonB-dependent receptor plug domain-containing protein [Gemmatimonadales bacterium]